MAKLEKLSEMMQNKVNAIVEQQGINDIANVEMMCCLKQRLPIVVSRANAATEFLTESGETVLIFVNEPILSMLTDEQQNMIINDALSGVYLDSDSGKLVINKPELVCSSWGHMKYGNDLLNAIEAFVLASQQAEEEEKEKKAAAKEAKKKHKEEL